jgi:hypothetical protein
MSQPPLNHKTKKSPSPLNEAREKTPKADMLVSRVATGLVATVILESGKRTLGFIAKNPLLTFGAGIITGYFAHQYRKEILMSSHKVAEETQDFVARQKQNLTEFFSEDKS